MLGFIIGLFLGVFLGVVIMCLCNVASKTDRDMENFKSVEEHKIDE